MISQNLELQQILDKLKERNKEIETSKQLHRIYTQLNIKQVLVERRQK